MNMRRWVLTLCLAMFAVVLLNERLFAAAPPSVDSLPIRASTDPSRVTATQPASLPSLGFDITRMFAALAIVLLLIFLLRWFLKRIYNGAASPDGGRVVQVLNRTILAPRQHVLLLQVGRRVVVVGESNGNMSTLAQIDDPDEIAQLVGKLHEQQSQRSLAFGGLFGRAQKKMEDDEMSDPSFAGRPTSSLHDSQDADARDPRAKSNTENDTSDESARAAGEMKSELSGLLEKVKSLRSQIGQ